MLTDNLNNYIAPDGDNTDYQIFGYSTIPNVNSRAYYAMKGTFILCLLCLPTISPKQKTTGQSVTDTSLTQYFYTDNVKTLEAGYV